MLLYYNDKENQLYIRQNKWITTYPLTLEYTHLVFLYQYYKDYLTYIGKF